MKALVTSFLIVGGFLCWKVENGEELRVGVDSIMGCGPHVRLSEGLVEFLQGQGCRALKDYCNLVNTLVWVQAWKSAQVLGIDGD